ncbi:thiol reductant ABC exporter subunit CydD [Speluncibacter jeojiensis]|uniref:thiol reductant ABC exporter subunit CydD n=1 Tax=Speluncibacter jeojiensis TaxID=2710754 RepID=UPI0039F4C36B
MSTVAVSVRADPPASEPPVADPPRRRGPVDPRLWRYSRAARGHLVLTVAASLVTAAAVIVSALMIGRVLGGVITDPARRTLGDWRFELIVLAAAIAVRTAATWVNARFGHRAALRVVAELKSEVLTAAATGDPRRLVADREHLVTVLTRGLDGLRPFLTGYLPALVLTMTVTPITLAVIFTQDLTSAWIVLATLPLIPVFMILIGLLTKGRAAAKLRAMSRLSAQLLDLIAGLPTLRALGRQQGPAARVRALGEAHRTTTMAALRLAFLSAMVLELLATLCVALVAVSIGLRLVFGDMSLQAGIIALILAPEVYLPLRTVGAQFHAAEDGVAAADDAFAIIEQRSAGVAAGTAAPPVRNVSIELENVSVRARSGHAPHRLTATAEPGRVTVLTGPNGAGKSTALEVLLGLIVPDSGRVTVGGVDLTGCDRKAWWSRVAWLPQHTALIPGTLAENLRLTTGIDPVPEADLAAAARTAGFDEVLAGLPDGWDSTVGTGGVGLSLGQRQRLGLVRVLVSDAPVLLLDEPTAHLDPAVEARVLAAIRERAAAGCTVLMVGHRPAVLAAADRVVRVAASEVADVRA